MSDTASRPIVVVTGANGLVGAAVCRGTGREGRAGPGRRTTPRQGASQVSGLQEHVGDFSTTRIGLAAEVVEGADAVVSTVHPLGDDAEVQE